MMAYSYNQDPVVLYRSQNILKTCTDPLVNHANKLRINLRSKDLFDVPSSRHGNVRRGSPRPYSSERPLMTQVYGRAGSAHRVTTGYQPTPTYIHNVVIPLNNSTGTSTCPTTYMSYSQTSRPKSRKGSAAYSIRSRSRVTSAAFDKYSTTSQREQSDVSRGYTSISGQVLRYKMEREDRLKCLTRKKTSQLRPHRVDRMYFMTGTPAHIEPKYRVEDEELLRLRELSRARKKASYYGRGLSGEDYEEVPHQPPPSSLGDAEALDVDEGAVHAGDDKEVQHTHRSEIDSISEADLTGPATEGQDINGETFVTQQMDQLSLNKNQTETDSKQKEKAELEDIREHKANTQLEDNDSGVDNGSVKSQHLDNDQQNDETSKS